MKAYARRGGPAAPQALREDSARKNRHGHAARSDDRNAVAVGGQDIYGVSPDSKSSIELKNVPHIRTTRPAGISSANVRPADSISGIADYGPIHLYLHAADGAPNHAGVVDGPTGDHDIFE